MESKKTLHCFSFSGTPTTSPRCRRCTETSCAASTWSRRCAQRTERCCGRPTDSDAVTTGEGADPRRKVELIPHIVEAPPSLRGIDAPKAETDAPKGERRESGKYSRAALRKKYNVRKDAYVVLLNCGNYELDNRKSLDVSVLAFERFYKKVPRAHLYLKTIS